MKFFNMTPMMAITISLGIALGGAFAADIIKERKDSMDALRDASKAINAIIEGGQAPGGAAEHAQKIIDIAKKIPEFFPKGSDQGDTKAKPEIWQNWDKFTAKSQDTEKAAEAVLAAANSGDTAALTSSFKALGGTCGSCHSDFKAK